MITWRKYAVSSLCFAMIREGKSNQGNLEIFLRLLSILESAEQERDYSLSSTPTEITRAIDFISENLGSQFCVSDAAKAAHVSVNTLERKFAEVLHMTPSAYIKQRRLAKAAEILPFCSSVGEVCEKCGFADYSNFISVFRRQFGVTPLKYKKLHEKAETRFKEG